MNKPSMKIGPHLIGEEHPPVVIAEIGINHEGCIDLAIELVDSALRAGAHLIKHQTHIVSDEMSADARRMIPGNSSDNIFDIMDRCALNEKDELKMFQHVQSKGGTFISTPFSRAAVHRLESFGVEAYKIGSGECNNYPLVKLIASYGKPIILSTGMNSLDSIRQSVEILRGNSVPFALLHTTNVYPTPDEIIRLNCVEVLRGEFPDAVVGLSDHSLDNLACLSSVILGASVLERHFTDHKHRTGPDIVCSMDEKQCFELVHDSRRVFQMRGSNKGPVSAEIPTINFASASVVTILPIKRGDVLTSDNIWVKRPAGGDFCAADFETLLGKIAEKDIEQDVQVMNNDVSDD